MNIHKMAEKYTHIDLSYTHLKLAGNPADEGCHRQSYYRAERRS